MDIITTSLTETIAGVGNGSVIPLGNVTRNTGFSVYGNRIKPKHKGTYHYNACLSVLQDDHVRVIGWCNGVVVVESVGKSTIPMAFEAGKGEVWFTLECSSNITIGSFAVSAFRL